MLPKSEWRTNLSVALEDEDEDTVPEVVNDNGFRDKEATVPELSPSSKQSKKKLRTEGGKGLGADATNSKVAEPEAEPCGEVVGIIQRHWRPYCCFVDPKQRISQSATGATASQSLFVLAMDRRVPKIRIRTRQAGKLVGQRLLVAIDAWPKESRYPQGHFIRLLGNAGDRATETEVLLLEHDVPYREFSAKVLADLPSEGDKWKLDLVRDGVESGKRRDLRDLDVCSIDPPGCTDIDDALHVKPLPNGNFQVGVHIADVTHFVKLRNNPWTLRRQIAPPLFTLWTRRIGYASLPLLGTNLCSLHCNVDRLAFSCIWEIDSEANIVKSGVLSQCNSLQSILHLWRSPGPHRRSKELTDSLTEGIRVC